MEELSCYIDNFRFVFDMSKRGTRTDGFRKKRNGTALPCGVVPFFNESFLIGHLRSRRARFFRYCGWKMSSGGAANEKTIRNAP